MVKRYAFADPKHCVACGACSKVCPRSAVSIWRGCFAKVDEANCVGCGLCEKSCPANAIVLKKREAAV